MNKDQLVGKSADITKASADIALDMLNYWNYTHSGDITLVGFGIFKVSSRAELKGHTS